MHVQGPNTYAADPNAFPFTGSIFTGIVLAYLCICVLLSVYLALVSVPEGGSSYLFMEPRGLIVANGVISFGSTYGVEQIFARYLEDCFGCALDREF